MTPSSFKRTTTVSGISTTGVVTQAVLGPQRAAVHVGRSGPLYRASAHPSGVARRGGAAAHSRRAPVHRPAQAEHAAMLDSTADALLRSLNRAYTRRPLLAIVLGVISGLALVEGLMVGASVTATLIFGSMALIAVVVVGRREVEHYSEAVEYVLDDHVMEAYRRLIAAFHRVQASGPVWHMGRRPRAGAPGGRRRLVAPALALPPRVRSNIRVPALRAGRQTLYFFPDRVLVYEAQMAWGIAYPNLKVKAGDVREVTDIESSGDMRDANGFFALASNSGLSAVFRCPSASAAVELVKALEGLA